MPATVPVQTTGASRPGRHGKPAENTSAIGGGLGAAIVGPTTHWWVGIVIWFIGVLPHTVTYLKDNGGVRGLYRALIGK